MGSCHISIVGQTSHEENNKEFAAWRGNLRKFVTPFAVHAQCTPNEVFFIYFRFHFLKLALNSMLMIRLQK